MAKEITFIIPEDVVEHERLHEEFWKRERERTSPRRLWNAPGLGVSPAVRASLEEGLRMKR